MRTYIHVYMCAIFPSKFPLKLANIFENTNTTKCVVAENIHTPSMGFSFFPKSETGGHFQIDNLYLIVCHRDLSVLFNIFMSDLSYDIEKSTLSTYADHTQIFSTDNKLSKDKGTINNDLITCSADIWLREMV